MSDLKFYYMLRYWYRSRSCCCIHAILISLKHIAAIEMAGYQNRLFSSTWRQYYWQYEIAAHMDLGDSFTEEIALKSFY